MLDAVQTCRKGWIYSADFDACVEDPKWLDPQQTTIVKVTAKADRPKVNWDWRGFWSGITLPVVTAPTRSAPAPIIYEPGPAAIPFWKTPLGIALMVAGAAGIIYLARKK
jgi:hypothetical protein